MRAHRHKQIAPVSYDLNWNRAMHFAVGLVVLWSIYQWWRQ